MIDGELAIAIRAFATERKYRAATVERWLALDPTDGAALLDLATQLRLGDNQLRDLWEWIEEIAARDRVSVAAVLAAEPVAAARRREIGRNDKLALIKSAVRRLRYPQLVALEERLRELIRALALPRSISVTLPDCLEGDTLRIEMIAADPAALHDAAERLARAAESSTCAEIFALLEEAP